MKLTQKRRMADTGKERGEYSTALENAGHMSKKSDASARGGEIYQAVQ